MNNKLIELIVAIAPSVGMRIKEYLTSHKRISNTEVNLLLLAQVLEQGKQVGKILDNHIQHEESIMKELNETLRELRADLIRSGIVK